MRKAYVFAVVVLQSDVTPKFIHRFPVSVYGIKEACEMIKVRGGFAVTDDTGPYLMVDVSVGTAKWRRMYVKMYDTASRNDFESIIEDISFSLRSGTAAYPITQGKVTPAVSALAPDLEFDFEVSFGTHVLVDYEGYNKLSPNTTKRTFQVMLTREFNLCDNEGVLPIYYPVWMGN